MRFNFIKALFTTWVGWIILYFLGFALLLILNSIEFKSGDFTRTYKGFVDNKTAITLNLVSKSGTITGYYVYDKFRKMVVVNGTINKKQILIDGYYNKKHIDKFEGTLEGNSIIGTWHGKEKNKIKDFEVRTDSKIQEKTLLKDVFSLYKILGIAGLTVLLIFLNFGIGPFERSKKIVMPIVISTPTSPPVSLPTFPEPTPMEVGQLFEGHIACLLPKEYYEFLEWRSDKSHNGLHPISNTFPDLHFRRTNTKELRNEFAVECKYRSSLIDGVFEFDPKQLRNYINFRKEKGIPVFLALGIGDTPEKPEHVFVIPITETTTTRVLVKDMGRYKLKRDYLFYDPVRESLG